MRMILQKISISHTHNADLENWNGTDRFHFNAIVSDQDFAEVKQDIHKRLFNLPSQFSRLGIQGPASHL